MKALSLCLIMVFLAFPTHCQNLIYASQVGTPESQEVGMNESEKEIIKQVVERAYIKGIHGNQDEKTVKSGFHHSFNMYVLKDDNIEKVSVDEWLNRIEILKAENPELWNSETYCNFSLIDVTDYSAVVKLNVFKGDIHFSTDYMLLYKFEDGWNIVAKIFSVPQ